MTRKIVGYAEHSAGLAFPLGVARTELIFSRGAATVCCVGARRRIRAFMAICRRESEERLKGDFPDRADQGR